MHFNGVYLCISIFVVLLVFSTSFSLKLGCKNEGNQDVDWYVNYKIPKLEKGYDGTHLTDGTAYAYISSSLPGGWRLSSNSIASHSSMLAKTLHTVIHNKQKVSYLFYNDEPPAGYNGTSNGHLKGIVAFTKKFGFWLIHSVPKFGDVHEYKYPHNALINGQSVLCVTFNVTALNEICKQLLHCSPKIYERQVTDDILPFLDDETKTLFSARPIFNRRPPFDRTTPLKSSGKQMFVSFAKNGQFKKDIYGALIAPGLRASLATETWRRGSGTYLPPDCNSNYTVIDVASIKMTAMNGNGTEDFSFISTEDHSKWAVSTNSSKDWICIGDMNRMASQEKRGGGALCFQSAQVGNAYQSLISDSDHCPV